MAFSAVLLAALYVLLIALMVAAGAGVVAIAVTLAVLVLAHYLGTERLILSALRARPVASDELPELERALEQICALAGEPLVRLARIESEVPGVFTIARSPLTATICLSDGLLELLDEEELGAVLAHELAHVASRNVVPMTLGSVWAALAAHVVRFDRRLPHRAGRDEPWAIVVGLAGLLFVVSYVTLQPLSRHRQLAADRAAFLLLRGSNGIASALQAIGAAVDGLEPRARRSVCGELTMLGLAPVDAPGTVATIFPTHPPLALRLARLADVARELFAAS
ncbi:MAG TPA: M48 family metalloprotease [Solirubrobacteraceae bacterium]|nr:M48 family metalloprotease [Solirubrobacteraceae bacterium]